MQESLAKEKCLDQAIEKAAKRLSETDGDGVDYSKINGRLSDLRSEGKAASKEIETSIRTLVTRISVWKMYTTKLTKLQTKIAQWRLNLELAMDKGGAKRNKRELEAARKRVEVTGIGNGIHRHVTITPLFSRLSARKSKAATGLYPS